MVEIRGVETGGLSGRNPENFVPHVQRSKGMKHVMLTNVASCM